MSQIVFIIDIEQMLPIMVHSLKQAALSIATFCTDADNLRESNSLPSLGFRLVRLGTILFFHGLYFFQVL